MNASTRRSLAVAVLAAATLASPAPAQERCAPTRPDMLGPFYTAGAPRREATGRGLTVSGRVRSAAGCGALAAAQIEWWSANSRGDYDDDHRATQTVDAEGRYRYETDFPGLYPGRPAHLHVRVAAPGHKVLVTQIYPKPGDRALQQDFVLVRE
jgi:protocatechuate 3,4-dioxygenase beta subunit